MVDTQTQTLFDLGAHLGHKKNRLHPKSRRYIYKIVNGISIIDLTLTTQNLDKAKKIMAQSAKEGKVVLVVATKKIVSQYTAELCKNNNIPFITTKWMSGLLTNFETVIKNARKLEDMKAKKAAGEWDKYVKHERMALDKEMAKLEKFYGGLQGLKSRPELIFIVDIKKEKNAVIEAHEYNIPIVAVTDTNSNPDLVTYPIVANDDSAEVVQYLINDILQAYIKGRT